MAPRQPGKLPPVPQLVRMLWLPILFAVVVSFALQQSRLRSSPQPIAFPGAVDALKHGKEADARREFEAALKPRPDDTLAYLNVMQACVAAKANTAALEYGHRALKACANQPPVERAAIWRAIAEVASLIPTADEKREALEAARQGHQLAPDDLVVANTYGYLLADFASGKGPDVDTAIQVLQKTLSSLKSTPGVDTDGSPEKLLYAMTEDSYGWALFKNEDYPDAITVLSEAIQDYPTGTAEQEAVKTTYLHLAQSYDRSGQKARALNALDNALVIDPGYAEAIAFKQKLYDASSPASSLPGSAPKAETTGRVKKN